MEINKDLILRKIINGLGIEGEITLNNTSDQTIINVRPKGFPKNRGILIQSTLKWKTLKTQLIFEDYAGDLVKFIGQQKQARDLFFECYNDLLKTNPHKLIEPSVDDSTNYDLNKSWSTVSMSIEQSPIDDKKYTLEEYVSENSCQILQCFLIFFPLEEIEEHISGLPEGARQQLIVNKYERSRVNRSICIQHFGSNCQVCNFNFERTYGIIGKGFIHVHHITPVSKIGPGYKINPIKDLIPLCPNCHSIVHKVDPPLSIQTLKSYMDKEFI